LQKQADCISTMTYNEYHQVLEAGVKPEDLVVFKYEDMGVATLEDGLYVEQDKLKDPAFVATMAKFVKASMMGWNDLAKDPKGAVADVLKNDASGSQTEAHQATMVDEVSKLVDGSDGTLDTAAADRTVATLLSGGSDPVITKKPEGAWTDVVTKAAAALK
ncbi:MAG: ABC transporter substrate-binding protein, partial [Aestuariivirga sp.]